MISRGQSASFATRGLDTIAWGESALREIDSLARESDSELYQQGLLGLAQRLVKQDRYDPALRLFHFIQDHSSNSPSLAAKAGREIDAIEGRGAVGGRVEFSLRRISKEAASPSLLLGMGVANGVYQVSRAAILGSLLAQPAASLLTRGLGARALAGLGAFALEAPSFVVATHGVGHALGETSVSSQSWPREIAGAYLSLGGLKLFASGAERALRLGGGSLSRRLIPQLGAYLGILAGRGLEHWSGLQKISSQDSLFLDALTTLLQFRIGGELSNRILETGFQRFQQGLRLAAEQAAPPLAKISISENSPAFAGIGTSSPTLSELGSAQPFAIQGKGSGSSGIWKSEGSIPSPLPPAFKIRWVPEGLPRLSVEEALDPVSAIVATLENHLKKIHPGSIEIHYQGRMIGSREQETLKNQLRLMIEDRLVPEGFLTAIAFLKGTPKMALIYSKENNKMGHKFTQVQVPEFSLVSPTLGQAATETRTLSRFDEIPGQLPAILQIRNPRLRFEGPWNIRDNMALSQLLEKAKALPWDQKFTVLLPQSSAQIVFGWETESGMMRIHWKTRPLDNSSLNLPAPPRESSPPEAAEKLAEGERSTLVWGDIELPTVMVCQDRKQALEAFSRVLMAGDSSHFKTPPIELRSGSLNEGDLGIIAEILNSHPLPEGRKISIVWVERPSGLLKVQNEDGKILAELRQYGNPIQNYLLKPYPATGVKRFTKIR